MLPDDVDLIERVAAGDEGAFMEFYDRYAPRVLGLLTRLLRDRTEAEDVLQECMLIVWRKADTFDAALASPATWVMMLARSRAVDRVRQRGRDRARLERLKQEAERGGPAEKQTAESAARTALDDLPPEQRSPIELAFFHGLTREQIAEVLGTPVGTVKTRIRAGMQKLRETLVEGAVP